MLPDSIIEIVIKMGCFQDLCEQSGSWNIEWDHKSFLAQNENINRHNLEKITTARNTTTLLISKKTWKQMLFQVIFWKLRSKQISS